MSSEIRINQANQEVEELLAEHWQCQKEHLPTDRLGHVDVADGSIPHSPAPTRGAAGCSRHCRFDPGLFPGCGLSIIGN